MKPVRAAEIAEKFGFTARHWIRQAAEGRIPGCVQPSGPGGAWLFDLTAFTRWAKPQGLEPKAEPVRQLEKIKKPKRADSKEDQIYVLFCGGLIKIGISRNFGVRARSFKTASPLPLFPLLQFPGTYTEECALHKRFEQYHSHGEWFHLGPEPREFIVEKGGKELLAHAETAFQMWSKGIQ